MKVLTLRNATWPVVLALAAIVGYVVAATELAWFQRVPYASLAVLAIAVGWSVALVRARRSVPRFAGLASTVVFASLFSWWTLGLSEYGVREAAVSDGEAVAALAEMSLPDHAGIARRVLAADGPTLLVLYRGHW